MLGSGSIPDLAQLGLQFLDRLIALCLLPSFRSCLSRQDPDPITGTEHHIASNPVADASGKDVSPT